MQSRAGGQSAPLTAKVAARLAVSSCHGLRCRHVFWPILRPARGYWGWRIRFQGSKHVRWEKTPFLMFARGCLELGSAFLLCVGSTGAEERRCACPFQGSARGDKSGLGLWASLCWGLSRVSFLCLQESVLARLGLWGLRGTILGLWASMPCPLAPFRGTRVDSVGEALIPWPTSLKAKTVWDVRGSRRRLGGYPGPEVDMRSERILWAGEMALGSSLVAEAPGSCFFQESQRKQEARFREELYCFHDGHPGWLPQPE